MLIVMISYTILLIILKTNKKGEMQMRLDGQNVECWCTFNGNKYDVLTVDFKEQMITVQDGKVQRLFSYANKTGSPVELHIKASKIKGGK